MSHQISVNTRYLLWRKRVPREQWADWLGGRSSLSAALIKELLSGRLADERVSSDDLVELAHALDQADQGESLRFADMPHEGCSILRENLSFLFEGLGHGGKKNVANKLSVDPTTVSRWLSGAYEPQGPSLRQLVSIFGLPPDTDLREAPVFLSNEPVAAGERRQWVRARIDDLAYDEFLELYPALRRMLGDR
jgi:transcriptional regulator with XRE-family HTH domain